MWARSRIRRHVLALPPGQLFRSRDLLIYGTRHSVDQTLYLMHKAEEIVRVAWGLYFRPDVEPIIVEAEEAVRTKAAVFGRQVIRHGGDVAVELGLIAKGLKGNNYLIDGRTSSFKLCQLRQRVKLHGTSKRKLKLGDGVVGSAIKALWYVGERVLNSAILSKAMSSFSQAERKEFRRSARWMPAWLSDAVYLQYNPGAR